VLTEMGQLADEAVVIHRGRLVRQAKVRELTDGSNELRVRTPEPDRLATVLRERGLRVRSEGADRLSVSGSDTTTVGTLAFGAGVPLLGLTEQQTSLEEAFLELTEEA
jgi:ABC-2 type transport system ATP-binding protein